MEVDATQRKLWNGMEIRKETAAEWRDGEMDGELGYVIVVFGFSGEILLNPIQLAMYYST